MDPTITTRLDQLRGSTVTQLQVDHALTLNLADAQPSPNSSLRIEGDFAYRDDAGSEHHYVEDYDRTTLGPVLELFGQTVAAVHLATEGELTITFDSIQRMTIPTHPHYESWTLSTPGQPTLASPPGGGPPVWPLGEYYGGFDAPLPVDDELSDLETWYAGGCDGDWEHQYGVTIETLDNPGWRLKVDLTGTSLEGRQLARATSETSPEEWLSAWSDGKTFDAVGGPKDLHRLVAAFRAFRAPSS